MRRTLAVALVLMIFASVAALPVAQAADEWRKMRVGDDQGYVMPNEVARTLGLERRDIPDEKNAATYYIQAADGLLPFVELPGEVFLHLEKEPWRAKDFPEVAQWFREKEPAFALLRKGIAQEQCQFPILVGGTGDTNIYARLLPYLAMMRWCARALTMRAHMLEGEGKHGEAVKEYLGILRLGCHMGQDELVISSLTGVGCDKRALREVHRTVLAGRLEVKDLQELLQTLLESERLLPSASVALRGDKAAALTGADTFVRDAVFWFLRAQLQRSRALGAFAAGRAWGVVVPDRTWRRDTAGFYDRMIAVAALETWMREGIPEVREQAKPWNVWAGGELLQLGRILPNYGENQAELYGVIQVVALRLYHAEKGKYPTALGELVPRYLADLPMDPFTGKPFVYLPMEKDFLLYSVGPNRVDDGGVPREAAKDENYDIVFGTAAP